MPDLCRLPLCTSTEMIDKIDKQIGKTGSQGGGVVTLCVDLYHFSKQMRHLKTHCWEKLYKCNQCVITFFTFECRL